MSRFKLKISEYYQGTCFFYLYVCLSVCPQNYPCPKLANVLNYIMKDKTLYLDKLKFNHYQYNFHNLPQTIITFEMCIVPQHDNALHNFNT